MKLETLKALAYDRDFKRAEFLIALADTCGSGF